MTMLADSDGLMASLYEAGAFYEVHGSKSGAHTYLVARCSGTPRKVDWVARFDTQEHFPWLITVTRDEGTNIRVSIDGEHWKMGSLQSFTFLFDRATGTPR
jgi:hypothetical protein